MAKVKFPFFSMHASGTIGHQFTARRTRRTDYMSEPPNPSNPNTGLQQSARGAFSDAAAEWVTPYRTAVDDLGWQRRLSLSKFKYSPYNYFQAQFCAARARGEIVYGLNKTWLEFPTTKRLVIHHYVPIYSACWIRWGLTEKYELGQKLMAWFPASMQWVAVLDFLVDKPVVYWECWTPTAGYKIISPAYKGVWP